MSKYKLFGSSKRLKLVVATSFVKDNADCVITYLKLQQKVDVEINNI